MTPPAPEGSPSPRSEDALPSWAVGICGVAAVASLLFSILIFLHQ